MPESFSTLATKKAMTEDDRLVAGFVLMVRELLIRATQSCVKADATRRNPRSVVSVTFRPCEASPKRLLLKVADRGAGFLGPHDWLHSHTTVLFMGSKDENRRLPESFNFALGTATADSDVLSFSLGDWLGKDGEPNIIYRPSRDKPGNFRSGSDQRVVAELGTPEEVERARTIVTPYILAFFRRLYLLPNRTGATTELVHDAKNPVPVIMSAADPQATPKDDLEHIKERLKKRFGHDVADECIVMGRCSSEHDDVSVSVVMAVDLPPPSAAPARPAVPSYAAAAAAGVAPVNTVMAALELGGAAGGEARAPQKVPPLPLQLMRYMNGIPLHDTDTYADCEIVNAVLSMSLDWFGLVINDGNVPNVLKDGLRFNLEESCEALLAEGGEGCGSPYAAAAADTPAVEGPRWGGARGIMVLVDVRSQRLEIPHDQLCKPAMHSGSPALSLEAPINAFVGEALARCVRALVDRGVPPFCHTRGAKIRAHAIEMLQRFGTAFADVIRHSGDSGFQKHCLMRLGNPDVGVNHAHFSKCISDMAVEVAHSQP